MDGTIWTNRAIAPTTVIASFAKDAYAIGDLSDPHAQDILKTISASMPQTPNLREALRSAWGSYAVTPSILHSLPRISPAPELAPGYCLQPINHENIHIVEEFWKGEFAPGTIGDFLDTRDFLYNSFGACVVHHASGLCVSACAAISVSRERCDFGLDTKPGHEGVGLATACSHMAVSEALCRKKRPVWVTDYDNHASQRVAAKLGFVKSQEFEIYKRLVAR